MRAAQYQFFRRRALRPLFPPDCGGPELELMQMMLREITGAPNAHLGNYTDARICVRRGCAMLPQVFCSWGE